MSWAGKARRQRDLGGIRRSPEAIRLPSAHSQSDTRSVSAGARTLEQEFRMKLAPHVKPASFVSAAAVALLLGSFAAAQAYPLRAPQVVFPAAPLQGYLNGVGESINVLTDQVDAQNWITSVSGNASFTLMIELAGNAPFNGIGAYNGNDPAPAPALFQIFPAAASAGWFASAHFSAGNLVVTLFDNNSIIMGQTFYAGVNASNFGFYISGPGGTFYSQDYRNGGLAHVLTYQGTGQNAGDWWECFEDMPWAAQAVDFDDAVLMLQSVVPTAAPTPSWGAVKGRYLR